jgi:hypothetical protein
MCWRDTIPQKADFLAEERRVLTGNLHMNSSNVPGMLQYGTF